MARYLSFITLLVVIVLLIILFYKVMAGFFVPLFLAALLVVIFRPMHVWFVGFCKGRKQVAALLTTASILLCVLVPLAILFALAAFESQQMVRSLDKDKLLANIGQARNKLNLTQPDIAVDLQDLEYRLINIAEQSRLEDIRYLANELNNTHLYNQEIGKELQDESPAIPAWEAYSEAFNELRAVQSQIANPEYSESELEEETDIPATMLHL
ncbi:MAG: AI-2E family transporter, partial [Planctomycetota bacterium]